jgi:signal transduction histidine kinase
VLCAQTCSILLVEDEPGDAGLIRAALRQTPHARFEIVWATNMAQARQHLSDSQFDVLLLDISLPDSTGLDTVRSGLAMAGDTPVVILTGREDDEFATSALNLGIQDYLIKSRIDGESLGRALRHALIRSRVEREHAVQMAKKTQALDEALGQAQAASQAKSRFLATMSHEVRTPLNAILGFTRLLVADHELKPCQHDQLQTVIRCGEHLLHLLDDVLDMARLESEPPKHCIEAFNLAGMLDDLEARFQAKAAAKGLSLFARRTPDPMPNVQADPAKLARILSNLLDNAVKFTRHGSVSLRSVIQPWEDGQAATLIVEVQDTGPGVSVEDREKLFEPFQQTTAGAAAGGIGLGLAVSRRYAGIMGGELCLDELPPDQGSLFRLSVPVTPLPDGHPIPSWAETARQPNMVSNQDGDESAAVSAQADVSLTGFPHQVLRELRTALDEGDMQGFTALLDELGPEREAQAGHLRALANRFDYEALAYLLAAALDKDNPETRSTIT